MPAYPLLFHPILKPKPWGGRRLERWGKTLPANTPIGESWELADLSGVEDGRSTIANGAWAGRTLHDVMQTNGPEVLGDVAPAADGRFPLLFKLLDARDNLSIQVHPSADYARLHPEAHLKSEAWYVLEAEPGSVIYAGLQPGTTADDLRRRLDDGSVPDALCSIPVRPGDCHYLPSGTCHALGAGILVAEVQTPSDTTFRLHDWQRTDRTLHIEQALACMNLAPYTTSEGEPPLVVDGMTTQPLTRTDHFVLERIDVSNDTDVPVVTNEIPEIWLVMDGRVRLQTSDNATVDVARGGTVLIPAAIGPARARYGAGASILRITLPSPLSGWIA